jgi:hypothetical protein
MLAFHTTNKKIGNKQGSPRLSKNQASLLNWSFGLVQRISGWIRLCQDWYHDQYSAVGDLGGDLVMTVLLLHFHTLLIY